MTLTSSKILDLQSLPAWREKIRSQGKILVVTNGCFDLLHVGHISYLERAKNEGNLLLIGLNSDASVQILKGPSRPVTPEADRAILLAALQVIDGVCIFPEPQATRFLNQAQPDVYVKGGDYTLETLNQDERRAVESHGGKIIILPFVPGKSTTSILAKIQKL